MRRHAGVRERTGTGESDVLIRVSRSVITSASQCDVAEPPGGGRGYRHRSLMRQQPDSTTPASRHHDPPRVETSPPVRRHRMTPSIHA